jgi:hypothetical protein
MVHEGARYNIEIVKTLRIRYEGWSPSRTRQNVVITDRKTGKRYQYLGIGQALGNSHPIFIRVGKRHLQLDEIERATEDLFPRVVRPHKWEVQCLPR